MKPIIHWCEDCNAKTEWVEPRIACTMTGKSRHTISNWINKGWLHTLALPSERRLICVRSILRSENALRAARKKDVQFVKNGKLRQLTRRSQQPENRKHG